MIKTIGLFFLLTTVVVSVCYAQPVLPAVILIEKAPEPREVRCATYRQVAMENYEKALDSGNLGRASRAALGALAMQLYNDCMGK